MNPAEIWSEQCKAAERIAEDFGIDNALGYIVGEKFLKFLKTSKKHPEFKEEISNFSARIKELFEQIDLAAYFYKIKEKGVSGYSSDDWDFEEFDDEFLEKEVVNTAEDIVLIEQAKEFLLDNSES